MSDPLGLLKNEDPLNLLSGGGGGKPSITAEEEALQEPGIVGTLLNPAEIATSALTGGITAIRHAKPILKEAADWATYGIPSLVKSVGTGIEKVVGGLSAKNIEKTFPVEKATAQTFAESGGKWLPMAAKATTAEMQGIIDLAKREKVSILAPDITGSRAQSLIFNAADKAIGGAGVTQKAAARVVQDIDSYSKRLLEHFGGEFEPTIMGSVARAGMEEKFQGVKNLGDELYKIAAQEAAGIDTTLSETTRVIREIQKTKDWQYLPSNVKNILEKVFDDIAPKESLAWKGEELPAEVIKKLKDQGAIESAIKSMDFTEVESIRRAVSKLTFTQEVSGNIGNKFATEIHAALEKDMEGAAKAAGTSAFEAYKAARDHQKKNIFGVFKGKTDLGQPSIGSRIETVANEDFLKLISRGNITELQEMKRVLPENTLQEVKRAWLTDLFSKHMRDMNTPALSGNFINAPRVAKILDDYGEKYLKTLFNDKEYKMIQEFKTLASHVGFSEKIASNPSGTAQTLYTISVITGGSVYGGATQDWKKAVLGTVFMFGSPYAIAKVMTSDAGFKFMTTGIKSHPEIRDIIAKSIKSAAMMGTHAQIDLNRPQEKPPEEGEE